MDQAPLEDVLGPVTEHSKVPLIPQIHINNKKALAVYKGRKQQQSKLRTMGHMDYYPLSIDKAQPEMVSLRDNTNELAKLPILSYYLNGNCAISFHHVPILSFCSIMVPLYEYILYLYNIFVWFVLITGTVSEEAGYTCPEDEGHAQSHGSVSLSA